MSTYEALDLGISTLSVVAIAFVVIQITTHNRQMHHDFEAMYLQRFWEVMERRSLALSLTDPRRRISRADQRFIDDYLMLSNDQVELRRLGRVTDDTWAVWAADIRGFASQPTIVQVLRRASSDDYGALRELLASDDPAWDPCTLNGVRRWFNGL